MDLAVSVLGAINFTVVAQLTFVGLILVSGPIVIFLMVVNRADL
ncbi:MAG: photosystem II reaction center protein Ycf12 [Cyanobacteria bacterium P01_F01_bin.150]